MDFVNAYMRSELWSYEISGLSDYRSDRGVDAPVKLTIPIVFSASQPHLGGGKSFSSDTQPCEAGVQIDCVKLKNKKKATHVAAYVY
jgi:hypothetical protein